MTPVEFETRHGPCWERLSELLAAVSSGGASSSPDIGSLPRLYRETCQHLALARDRGYPQHLVDRLNELARRGHEVLYRPRTRFLSQAWHFIAVDFPERVRAERVLMLISAAAFLLPLVALGLLLQRFPSLVHSTLEPGMLIDIERMYAPGGGSIGKLRSGDTDLMMFGHYINNNIGISFQVFATGIVPFIGPMFYLLLNGIIIGSVAGHLTHIGFGGTFWPFVSGHGSFELTAIVISGGAGLMLSRALVAPGDMTRRDALVAAARDAVRIMYGVVLMLVIAAAIEAFWSSSRWTPAWVKYSAAAVLWAAVAYYFVFQGRARGATLWTWKR